MKRILRLLIGPVNTRLVLIMVNLGHRLRVYKQYQPIPDLNLALDMQTPRNVERLRAIRENIPEKSVSGMDIGCNIGYFIFELAKVGYTLFGIEGDLVTYRILNAAKDKLRTNNVMTGNFYITPDNIHCLPEVDFALCLAVFHHWCVAFGEKTALNMLGILLGKCRKAFFFEPPFAKDSSEKYRAVLPDRTAENPEKWWTDYFLNLGYSEVKQIYRGSRVLFLIKP